VHRYVRRLCDAGVSAQSGHVPPTLSVRAGRAADTSSGGVRLIRLLALVLLAAYVIVAILLFVVRHDDRAVRADAVVVLSGSKRRLPVGVRLMREHLAPVLVVSRSTKPSRLEAAACAGKLPYEVICFRARPYSTRGEARGVGRLARRHGWKRLDVVTSHFHVFRARIVIRRCFHGDVHMVGAPQSIVRLPLDVLHESAKLAYQETVQRGC
jgi:uncharacterized SAM-binding protein YcdF (DUF218 family)